MRILFIVFLVCATCGCGLHHPLLGTRVHRFTVGGVNLVHCSILIDTAQTQMAHDALEVCRDEIAVPVAPSPQKK